MYRILLALLFVAPLAQAVEFVDRRDPDPQLVELGRLLFHDKILSGNRNISCATCHHPLTDTGDGRPLPVGEGGNGLGVMRDTGTGSDAIVERVPRNAPPVFMLGSTEVTRMFHDGRIQFNPDFPSACESPAGYQLPDTLDGILAAQAMFPVTSPTEMAGQGSENRVAKAAAAGDLVKVWVLLAERLREIPEYVALFSQAFPDISAARDITFAHAANAIAAFEVAAWRADGSPYDAYLKGKRYALTRDQRRGLRLFFGKAGCARCHSGEIFSDMQFHAIAMPQIGPGKGNGESGHEDWGRWLVTGAKKDKFKFRTPPLRNIALTAPYGHAGTFETLKAVVRHHLDPVASLYAYADDKVCEATLGLDSPPELAEVDCLVMNDPKAIAAIAKRNELAPVELSETEVTQLIAFLHALTDPQTLDLRAHFPRIVPSGLTVVD